MNERTKEIFKVIAGIVATILALILAVHLLIYLFVYASVSAIFESAEPATSYDDLVVTSQTIRRGYYSVLSGGPYDSPTEVNDWGNHIFFAEGDIISPEIRKISVKNVTDNEIVMIQYYMSSNGADRYAIAELGDGTSTSNDWDITREDNEVIFETDSYVMTFSSVAILNTDTKEICILTDN